ncbi:deazaflavin-dependent oxidoreductase, nitroreductase family [Geodermatophilus obscurus]|uniref:Deazaflavin-dependent oxidoreductase, nitroreductase family n=1 Tax=Geodermatophilus obscurus TaxID=1861 RepID=A0A1M7UXK0_9ACTN|nr:MBL fold metallo-hydrolase [Geodermatophilus obscurus]SHN87761.1 deazaflavin-dependent oxidoreductase, nitroreductase family [Geodermatophilus obscurus]
MGTAGQPDRSAALAPRALLEEAAAGVYRLRTGRFLGESNVYLVASGSSWVLVDAARPSRAPTIRAAAEAVFGPGTRPAAMLLTHVHPDHSGAAYELARVWGVPVHVHPAEIPPAAGEILPGSANPIDRYVLAPLLRLLPRRPDGRRDPLADVVAPFDPDGAVPGLPDWRCVPTPGHTPGSVAFLRPADRVLIAGDAVLTVDTNSIRNLAGGRYGAFGPPWITTWDWARARASVARLAELDPAVLAPGHGRPLTCSGIAAELRALDQRMARPLRATEGFFREVRYSSPGSYRRPPAAYRRMQWLAHVLTRLGWSPGDVVNLEVPGRRTGTIRTTTLLTTVHDGHRHLVALAGESDWVRNVRAARGHVVLGRRDRRAATLVELPTEQRPAVLRAYLLHAPRRRTQVARHYFGVGADPSDEELLAVAGRYPVFRIVERAAPSTETRGRP